MEPNKRPKMDIDRLSELPEAMVHHILSFLPTVYAIRMSVLSKRWKKIWLDLPVLDLSSFGGIRKSQKLCSFAYRCFKLHETHSLSKFKFKTSHSWRNIEGWLKLVAKSTNLKELDIDIHNRKIVFWLPKEMLQLRSLTHLSLHGVSIEGYDSLICLSSLTVLSLKTVRLDDRVFNNLLLSCSDLEKLTVDHCFGLSSFKISSPRLKFLELNAYDTLTVQVKAPNLESFVFSASLLEAESVFSCRRLRALSLSFMDLKSKWFESVISEIYCLESLTLRYCTLKSFEIRSHDLKRFVFQANLILTEPGIVMDTPNLAYLSFMGNPILDIEMNLPNLQEATLKLVNKKIDATWYTNLLYFLSNISCAKTVGLYVHSEEALIIPDRLRKVCKAPSLAMKHLNLRTREKLLRNNELKNSLFWIAPSLETFSMEQEQVID